MSASFLLLLLLQLPKAFLEFHEHLTRVRCCVRERRRKSNINIAGKKRKRLFRSFGILSPQYPLFYCTVPYSTMYVYCTCIGVHRVQHLGGG